MIPITVKYEAVLDRRGSIRPHSSRYDSCRGETKSEVGTGAGSTAEVEKEANDALALARLAPSGSSHIHSIAETAGSQRLLQNS